MSALVAIIAALKSGNLLGAVKAIGEALAGFFDFLDAKRAEELGRLKEREKNADANSDLADRIRSVDPGVVPDDIAFGVGGRDNDLPRSKP